MYITAVGIGLLQNQLIRAMGVGVRKNKQLEVPSRGFSEDEFRVRTQTAQARMAEQDLAGMLLMSEPEVRYFTGFQTLFWQSPTRPWFVFLPADGMPVAVIPEIGAELMRRCWLSDIRTWCAPAPQDDGISLLIDLLLPLSTRGLRLGVMKGHETSLRMPLGDWEKLLAALPGLVIADATHIVQGLRMVKSPAEIEKLSHICAIGSAAFAQVPETITVGDPLEEIFREFRRSALAMGADDAPYVVGAAGQGGYADVISPPTRCPLKAGDVLMMDTGCTWDGYFCDFDRNWAIETASHQAKQAYDVLWRATQAGIDAARPGNTSRDLFLAMSAVLSEFNAGAGDIGRLGHGLGMQLTEQPSHAMFDETVIEENMVLTIEPSLSYGDGLMMVHEENVVVSAKGAKLLTTRAATDLPVV